MKKLFCIIGLTGSGKSEYYKKILEKFKMTYADSIEPLVYHTTRSKREGEEEGVDYHFTNIEQYNTLSLNSQIVERRVYHTENNGNVVYFTTLDDINETKANALLTVASIDQLENYIKYNEKCQAFDIYVIKIECDTNIRVDRVSKNRCKTEEDFLELSRRMVQESKDWEIEKEVISKVQGGHYIKFNNNEDGNFENINTCYTWIWMNT